MTPQLSTTVIGQGRSIRLLVTGEIDLASYEQFERAVVEAARRHGRILLDLTKVQFMSSVGIRVLYTHRDQVKAVLVRPGSIITRALSVAGLETVIPVDSA
jgi:anti-anti-sigma factor